MVQSGKKIVCGDVIYGRTQNGHDSRLGSLVFDQGTDNFVIEILDFFPGNALLYIFFLKLKKIIA